MNTHRFTQLNVLVNPAWHQNIIIFFKSKGKVLNLKTLHLNASLLGKQSIPRVTGISVFLEKTLGLRLSSFHLKIICCSWSRNVFHWPRGPSIFKPDWSTGQMPESSSGIRGGHVKVESESERDSLCEERKKNKQEKKKKEGTR